jgi:hypothetical protein
MKSHSKSILTGAILPVALGMALSLGSSILPTMAPQALAQSANPCGAKANPCAAKNPCAARKN